MSDGFDYYAGGVIGFGTAIALAAAIFIATTSAPTAYTGTVQSTFVTNNGNNGQVLIKLGTSQVTCALQANNAQNTASLIGLKPGDNVSIFQYNSGGFSGFCLVAPA